METAKWLEHHFGSESTGRSSTGNLSEEEDEDEQRTGRQKTTSNSFINVTMKSTETPANGYFKGVSEWKAGGREPAVAATSTPVRAPIRRKRDQRTTQTTETVVVGNGNAVANELESSPLFNSVQQRVQGYEMTREKLSGRNAVVDGHNNRSHHNGYGQVRDRYRSGPVAPVDLSRSYHHRALTESASLILANHTSLYDIRHRFFFTPHTLYTRLAYCILDRLVVILLLATFTVSVYPSPNCSCIPVT